MPDRPEEKYEPGELQQTRHNLGEISREESKEMSRRLGGEVGIEKTDPSIDRQYQDLKYKNRDEMVEPVRTTNQPLTRPSQESHPGANKKTKRVSFGYWDRLRTAFLMSSEPYRYKTRFQAFQTIFSFFLPISDRLNPAALRKIDAVYYQPLEELILSLREILPKKQPVITQALRLKPYSQKIYNILLSWDMESVSHELTQIQRNPRRTHTRDFQRFLIYYCRPLIQLSKLDTQEHVLPALHQIFSCSVIAVIPQGPEYRKRQKALARCLELFPYLQDQLLPQLYPLLMANFASRFQTNRQFFVENRKELHRGLQLGVKDLMNPPTPEENGELNTPVQQDVKKQKSEAKKNYKSKKVSSGVGKGQALLGQLFPDSGWENLRGKPDFYPYFQPLYDYEKGAELIPREDPIQAVLVLLSIIEDLLPAFRTMKFGTIQDETNTARDVRSRILPTLENWGFFKDNIINQKYLPQLEEYCRQIERTHSFEETRYGKKLAEELSWLKRSFFFPNFFVIEYREKHPTRTGKEPALYEQTAVLTETLSSVLYTLQNEFSASSVETLSQFEGQVLSNPGEKPHFEVSNPVSSRMKALLKKPGKNRFHNFSILYFSYNILQLLHTILLKPETFYGTEIPPLFRSVRNEGKIPEYTITLRRTWEELQKQSPSGKNPLPESEEEEIKTLMTDTPSGLGDEQGFREQIKENIRQIRSESHDQETFCLLLVAIPGFETYRISGWEEAAARLLQQYHLAFLPEKTKTSGGAFLMDSDNLAFIMPDKDIETAADMVRSRIRQLSVPEKKRPQILPVQAGIMDYDKKWNSQYFLELAEKTVTAACQYPPQSLAVSRNNSLQIDIESELPLVEALDTAQE